MSTTQKQSYTVGKHPDNDIECIGRYVDDFHAVIYFEKETWWIKDKDSQFYTFVNNVKVEMPMRITSKDLVRLGTEILHWWEEVQGEPEPEDPFYLSDILEWRGSISSANFWTFFGVYSIVPITFYIFFYDFFKSLALNGGATAQWLLPIIFGTLSCLIMIPILFQVIKLFRK